MEAIFPSFVFLLQGIFGCWLTLWLHLFRSKMLFDVKYFSPKMNFRKTKILVSILWCLVGNRKIFLATKHFSNIHHQSSFPSHLCVATTIGLRVCIRERDCWVT